MLERERILITVRTYPTISAQYIETVCTGGITDGGVWRRLVPVPLRYLEEEKQYRTYDVVEVDVQPGQDGRPETRRPHLPSLQIVDHLDRWRSRCDWVNPTVVPSLKALTAAGRTLGPVAVKEVSDLEVTKTSGEWTAVQQEKLRQADLFHERQPLEKVPFDFHLHWVDEEGEAHRSLVMAWELLQTYRQFRRRYDDPIPQITEKLLGDVLAPSRRVALFMGNLAKRRTVFGVCGWFAPPSKEAGDATLF